MFGPNIDVYDMDFLAKVDRMLDGLGIDTIEMGNAVAMCMEGGKIAWGDQEAVLALLREVEQGTEFGKTLSQILPRKSWLKLKCFRSKRKKLADCSSLPVLFLSFYTVELTEESKEKQG